MRVLAIETTERTGSLAASIDGRLLALSSLSRQHRTAQTLAPALGRLLVEVEWKPQDVDLVAVTVGPGSFTGLRIGVTTAKVMAYAMQASILGVDTLEAIAARAPDEEQSLWSVVDAQRGEVVTKPFRRGVDGWWRATDEIQLVDAKQWMQDLRPGTTLSGPALVKYGHDVPDGVSVLDSRFWSPTAEEVARLAERDFGEGRRNDVWSLVPHYSRLSAAEEKWQQRQRDQKDA